MKLEIIEQTKNPYLGREEMTIQIESDTMPTKEALIEELKKDAELCDIKKIDSNFGREKFIAEIIVYDDKESKDKYMTIPRKIKKKMEEERKAAEEEAKKKAEEEAAAQAVEAEKPAEEESNESPAENAEAPAAEEGKEDSEEKSEEVKEEAKE